MIAQPYDSRAEGERMRMSSVLSSFLQDGPNEIRWAATGITVVAGAIWSALTGIMTVLLVVLFLVDVGLGMVRSMHCGGVKAFSWTRFYRAGFKFAAAMLGAVLGASLDLLIQESSGTKSTVVLPGVLVFMAGGFAWSAAGNLAYFFPGVEKVLDKLMRQSASGRGRAYPNRRSTDKRGSVADSSEPRNGG